MRRSEHAGVYDPVGHQLVVYGGSTAVPVNCGFPTPTFEDETWIYDITCNSWRQVQVPGPGGRARHMMAYDSTEHRVILFGGRYRDGASGNYSLFNDLWGFDLETETWSLIPAAPSGFGTALLTSSASLTPFAACEAAERERLLLRMCNSPFAIHRKSFLGLKHVVLFVSGGSDAAAALHAAQATAPHGRPPMWAVRWRTLSKTCEPF